MRDNEYPPHKKTSVRPTIFVMLHTKRNCWMSCGPVLGQLLGLEGMGGGL